MVKKDNFIIISGNGRNSGKTTMACSLIKELAANGEVLGLKVSPHLHEQDNNADVLLHDVHYMVMEERNQLGDKDSSRMLRAGATKVIYAQVTDDYLSELLPRLLAVLPENIPVVCESAMLRQHIEPGRFIIMNKIGNTVYKERIKLLKAYPHEWIEIIPEEYTDH